MPLHSCPRTRCWPKSTRLPFEAARRWPSKPDGGFCASGRLWIPRKPRSRAGRAAQASDPQTTLDVEASVRRADPPGVFITKDSANRVGFLRERPVERIGETSGLFELGPSMGVTTTGHFYFATALQKIALEVPSPSAPKPGHSRPKVKPTCFQTRRLKPSMLGNLPES